MRTKNALLFLALVIVLFQGCIPSLHPLYTKDKLVMKKEVPGTWVDRDLEKEISFSKGTQEGTLILPSEVPPRWNFEANDNQSYSLVYYDDEGRPAAFDAHLVQLGENYFFNFFPRDPTDKEKEKYPDFETVNFNQLESLHYFQVNTFAKVTFEDDQMTISMFDGEFLEKLLDQNRVRIKHEKTRDRYILTTQPEELQKFIMKYAEDKKAFPDPIVLVKSV